MKTFNPSIVLELAKEGFSFYLIVAMELESGTYRYVDADIDLWYGGYKYTAMDFVFDQVETSGSMSVDTVSVTFGNADLTMGAMVLSEDILGRPFTLSFICVAGELGRKVLTESLVDIILEGGLVDGEDMLMEIGQTLGPYSIIGGHSLFYGLISDWKIEEEKVWVEIQNELVFWSKRTLRKCDSSCPWEFKGTECGYAGGQTWCNQSYERCSELSNTSSFAGHRFLPDIEEKDIWWGKNKE